VAVGTTDVSVTPGTGWAEVVDTPTAPWYIKPNFAGGYRFAITSGSAPSGTVGACYGANPYLPYEGIGPLPSFTGKAYVKVDAVANQAQVTNHYPVVFTVITTA